MSDDASRRAYREKLASIGFLSRGRTRPRVREGREHPESGQRWKTVTDEHGNDTTYHAASPLGADTERVDVEIRPPAIAYPDKEIPWQPAKT
jgi:hypothetical protein